MGGKASKCNTGYKAKSHDYCDANYDGKRGCKLANENESAAVGDYGCHDNDMYECRHTHKFDGKQWEPYKDKSTGEQKTCD